MAIPGGGALSGKAIAGIAGGIAAVGVTVGVILSLNGQDSFRLIEAVDTIGQVDISRDGSNLDTYPNMKLESGDDVRVGGASELDMRLDEDKYVYVEENTHMWLEASGTAENSNTVIYMDAGATMHNIEQKLNDGSSYMVETPNATMSIRGTIPRVVVYMKDGIYYTDFQVFEGSVTVQLKTTDGKPIGDPVTIPAGYDCLTRGDNTFSEIVLQPLDGKDEEQVPIDYREIPSGVLKKLRIFIEEGRDIHIGDRLITIEELDEYIEEALKRENGEEEPAVITPVPTPEPTPVITPEVTPQVTPRAIVTPTAEVTPVVTETPTPEPSDDEEEESTEEDSTPSECTITYMYNGSVFATQKVAYGGSAGSGPSLKPNPNGSWDSLPTEVTSDIVVTWN